MSTMTREATRELRATRVTDDIYRVDDDDETIGYVLECGRVYVSLAGPVYNTAVEVAQSLDLATALRRLRH